MATDTGPWRARASCRAVSFPWGMSTKPSQFAATDFRRNLQAAWSWKKGNARKSQRVAWTLLCQHRGSSSLRQYPCSHGRIWRRCPSNLRCILRYPNCRNNPPVVVRSNWLICLRIERGDFPRHQSTERKQSIVRWENEHEGIRTYRAECPTWTALTLVFHRCDNALVTPIDGHGQGDERWGRNVRFAEIGVLRTVIFVLSVAIELRPKLLISLESKALVSSELGLVRLTRVAYWLTPSRYVCRPKSCSRLCLTIIFTCLAKIWKRWISSTVVL